MRGVRRFLTFSVLFATVTIWSGLHCEVLGQSLYKVSLGDRIDQADAVIEGRVVDQRAVWNRTQTLIQTVSTIRVYRAFKGNPGDPEDPDDGLVEIVTPGGVLGYSAHVVTPSLSLDSGDVGVFFLREDTATLDRPVWKPYASLQGFVQYNEENGLAFDPFDEYPDIETTVYRPIEQRLGARHRVVAPFETPRPGGARGARPKGSVAPVVTTVAPSPMTAGTSSELTIQGIGFEAYDGGTNSAVFFPNADDGGKTLRGANSAYVTSWTDTEIKLNLPSGSGSGKVTVQSASRQTGVSAVNLMIDFNRIEVVYQDRPYIPDLVDKNRSGGYSLALSSSTTNNGVSFFNSDAVAPFERALATWQAETGFNLKTNGGVTASSTVKPQSPPDIVMFDDDDPQSTDKPLPAGILGRTFSGYSSCNGTTWWLAGVDMVFRRDRTAGITWNFGTGPPPFQQYDFESVALHELGHAHQLGHIIAPGRVMHYAISNGTQLRTLDPIADVAGGLYVLQNTGNLASCGESPMTPLVGVAVEDDGASGLSGFVLSAAYPNPFKSSTEFQVSVGKDAGSVDVGMHDVLGRSIDAGAEVEAVGGGRYRISVDGSRLVPGVYLVTVTSGGQAATVLVTRI